MKKINELLSKRAEVISKMDVLSKAEALTEEEARSYDNYTLEVEKLDKDIARLRKQEELNKSIAENKPAEEAREEEKPFAVQFRDWLSNAINGSGPRSFRADPILTSTTSAVINKTVANSVDILTSPGEAFLRGLGITFYPNLNGNFVVPSMAEDTAAFVAEDASAASASMLPEALTLAARRVTHTQSISRETLVQTNPAIYASILQNLVNGIWNAVTNDVFDTLESDGATQIKVTGTTVTNTDIVNMEASIGGLSLMKPAYVTTPTGKAFFKKTIARGTTAGDAIWMDDEMNGYAAYGVPAANANRVYFGDWSKQVVGQWGGLDIIVDEVTGAKTGTIKLTAVGLFDTGCANKRAFAILDASLA